ncbi:hypothetical protein PP568_17270 [Mycobacteroides abscessus]|uniref:Transmembrane protein n=2 Tax=Mycobacteroides abscessus TaxID=36809 RepID=A0AB38CWQ5_9MYCO|nr:MULTISPECIES: hypothetical protein [Mycobacteroides]MBE5420808.1 hypothetical protein [Mycobacteroides abscessus]MBN7462012.1 hypothetical protein [Mycobacteroides abscessus subsp. abscessus]MBN7557469.1 hypothetical protein [Mycobacteroides abscessus subsp. abscessus]MDM2406963.1 hypothetical protein [Mycobacteroides abscessus]MDM2416390.1 hypothetical protein [Mycobacteroides abscessus]
MKKLVPMAIILGILGLASMVYWSAILGLLLLIIAGALGYAAYQSHANAQRRITPAAPVQPTEWADARYESRNAMADAEDAERRLTRAAVKKADKRGKAAVQRATERVQAEQAQNWIS